MTRHDPHRDEAILAFIDGWWTDHGFGPSVRDIARGVGLASTAAAQHWIVKMAKAGTITHDPALARSIRVVRDGDDLRALLAEHLCRSQHGLRPRRNPPCKTHRMSADYLVYLLNESDRRRSPLRLVAA